MKKFLALGVLSLAGLALSAAEADAWLFDCCRHHINRYSTFIACRPYNAFTPTCFGNIICDGCCPAPFCGSPAPMWRPQVMPPVMAGPPQCCDPCCGPEHALASVPGPGYPMAAMPPLQPMPYPQQPMPYPPPGPQGYHAHMQPQFMPYAPQGPQGPYTQPTYQHPMPPGANGAAPGFVPPAPTPVPVQTSQRWNPQAGQGVQPAGYYPSYYPAAYYPMQNYLMYPASTAPSYWYGR